MATHILEALAGARFALLASKATQRLEMKAVEREVVEITTKVEDAVEMLIAEVENVDEVELASSQSSEVSRSEPSFSRPARVVLDRLADAQRKIHTLTDLMQSVLRSYTDSKQQCDDLASELATIGELQECKNCKRCLAKITEFHTEIVQLRAELAKTEALLIDSRQAKEQLSKELGDLSFRNKELERSKAEFVPLETLELQRELKQAEMTIGELDARLQSSIAEAATLRTNAREAQAELEPRDSALRKAQTIIKKLNAECEHLAEQLHASEGLCEVLKRDAHQYEKSFRDSQIQLQSLEVAHKTESRLRDEVQSLKSALDALKEESADESQRLQEYLAQLTRENEALQQQIVELENSIVTLDAEARQHEEATKLHEERISDLEQALALKIREMDDLQRAAAAREDEAEAEIAHIKRVAENAIRSKVLLEDDPPRSARSPVRSASPLPTKRAAHLKTTTVDTVRSPEPAATHAFAVQHTEEKAYREEALKAALQTIVAKSAVFLREKIQALGHFEASMRPETERWIMRNEELETIITDLAVRITRLTTLNRDLQKAVRLRERQLEEERKCVQSLLATSEDSKKLLTTEVDTLQEIVLGSVFEKSKDVMGLQADVTMKTVGELKQKAEWLQEHSSRLESEVTDWQSRCERLASDLRTAEESLAVAQQSLAQRDSDFGHIRALLAAMQLPYLAAEEAQEPAMQASEDAEEVMRDVQALHRDVELKAQDMDRLEGKMRELIATNRQLQQAFEDDKDGLLNDLRVLRDEKAQLERECLRLSDNLQAEERQRESAEDEIRHHEGVIDSLRLEIAAVTHDRDALTHDNAALRETLDHQQDIQEEVKTLKSANDRLLQELDDAHNELAAMGKLKEQTLEQTAVISQLKGQLGKSGSESLLTEGSMLRRDFRPHRSSEESLMAIDRLLTQKEEYIKELEMRLEQGKTDVLGMTAHSSVFDETQLGETDTASLRRAKNKITAYKRSFNKRLEEFESVLRLIEDAVSAMSHGHPVKYQCPASSNSTLDSWVETLLQDIATCAASATHCQEREVRLCVTSLGLIQSAEVVEEDRLAASSLLGELQKQGNVDMEFVATQVTSLLRRALVPDARKTRSFPEEGVCISSYHARLLISAIGSLDSIELALVERKESILQVSDELDGLTRSLAGMPVRSSELPSKIADMFSKFSMQFLQDLKRDLQAFAEALRDLKDVTRSNPLPSAHCVSLWTFSQASRRL